jgi:toxin ParE1/3/4
MIADAVEIAPRALAEIDETMEFLARRSPAMAERWYLRLRDAFESLRHHTDCHPTAPEDEWFDGTLRQLLQGERPHVYRILFEIRGRTVSILRVRHGRQRLIVPEEW